MKTKKTYLREVAIPERFGTKTYIDIVEFSDEEIESDKSYWEKHQLARSVRYFELKEKR